MQISFDSVSLARFEFTLVMESDDIFINLDWDPSYLASIFDADFYDMSDLWDVDYVGDNQLLEYAERRDIYCPMVEEISIEDEVLCKAVEQIESQ